MSKLTKSDWPWIVAFIVVAIAIRFAWAQLVYGDLSCAFAECRKVKY